MENPRGISRVYIKKNNQCSQNPSLVTKEANIFNTPDHKQTKHINFEPLNLNCVLNYCKKIFSMFFLITLA